MKDRCKVFRRHLYGCRQEKIKENHYNSFVVNHILSAVTHCGKRTVTQMPALTYSQKSPHWGCLTIDHLTFRVLKT